MLALLMKIKISKTTPLLKILISGWIFIIIIKINGKMNITNPMMYLLYLIRPSISTTLKLTCN